MRESSEIPPADTGSAFVIILAGTIVAATGAGAVAIPAREIITVLGRKLPLVANHVEPSAPPVYETIIMVVRFPRVVLAAFVRAALSAARVVLQALFRNPLADPYLIGASSGAAFGGKFV
jgi:iron complex transport system permease protein